jgi:hypothetical protein
MFNDAQFRPFRFTLSVFALAVLCLAAARPARAQDEKEPPFHEFKGVSIGMKVSDARQKLGSPTDKSDVQDLYSINDKQTALVYYDGSGNVSAIALMFTGAGADVPTPKSIFGADVEAKSDGSISKMVRYTKAGYFVAYNRTAGDSPMITITIQKIR